MGFAWRCAPFAGPRLTAGAGQGVVLAATFAVSHNVREAKPLARGAPRLGPAAGAAPGGVPPLFWQPGYGEGVGKRRSKTERKKCQSVGVFSTLFRWTHHGLPRSQPGPGAAWRCALGPLTVQITFTKI